MINEPRLIAQDIKNRILKYLFYSFTLWEISLYSILILYTDFHEKGIPYVAIFMMVGYILGSVAMKFCKGIRDATLIKYGYIFAIFSLVPYIISSIFNLNQNYLLVAGYFFHAVGNAILCPTLLSLTSQKSKPRQRGRRYGILDSCDTIAFLIASIAIMAYRKFNLDIIHMVIFSFLTMSISWIPYAKFKELNRELK